MKQVLFVSGLMIVPFYFMQLFYSSDNTCANEKTLCGQGFQIFDQLKLFENGQFVCSIGHQEGSPEKEFSL